MSNSVANYPPMSTGRLLVTSLAIFGCLWISSPATACPVQESTEDDPAASVTQEAETPTENPVAFFRNLMTQVREQEKEINRLYSTMPIGFPKMQQEYTKKIDALKKSSAELGLKIDEAALASFRAVPNADPQATRVVMDLISQKPRWPRTAEHFDPNSALKLANEVLQYGVDPQSGKSTVEAAYLAFRASYAIHDFDMASKTLDFIEQNGVQLDDSIRNQLIDTQAKWKRELEIRQREAAADDLPRVKFETTEGDFVVELFENEAPKTVGNFISLVEKKFYNDLIFHLVKPGQLSQTGCPLGDGTGDAGYKIPCETDTSDARHHFAGTLSMANNGKDTGGSQFFIAHQPNPNFDNSFTVFGRVIEGLDVVYRIKTADATLLSLDSKTPSKIIRATVLRKRDHEYKPTRLAVQPRTFRGKGAEVFQAIPDKEDKDPGTSNGG